MNNNNNANQLEELKQLEEFIREYKNQIKPCYNQLHENKKVKFGFDLRDSVIDVEERGYGISTGYDILYTYGIDTCTAIAIIDETKNLLMHIDSSSVDDVKKIYHKFNFSPNTKVFIFPGAHKMTGQFDYKSFIEYLKSINVQYQIERIPATFGFVKIDYNGTVEMGCLNKTYFRSTTKSQQNNNNYNKL